MLSITLQDLLQGREDHQTQDHFLYSIRDGETLFYIGQTKNDPKERLFTHIFAHRNRRKQSNVGVFILQNLPTSLNWVIDLYTLKDCEPILIRFFERIEKDNASGVIFSLYKTNEIVGHYVQTLIDTLSDLCTDSRFQISPVEEQEMKEAFLSMLDTLSVCSKEEALNIWNKVDEKLEKIGKEFVWSWDEKYPLVKVLERYYDYNYRERAMKTVEAFLIAWGRPCLNISGNSWFQTIPDKYAITGLNSKILQRNSCKIEQASSDPTHPDFKMIYHFLIHQIYL